MTQSSLRNFRFRRTAKAHEQALVCPRCRLEQGEKYRAVRIGKHERVLLNQVVGNLYSCPKCSETYYDKDFQRFASGPKKPCLSCGCNYLRYDPRTRELICTGCGTVQ